MALLAIISRIGQVMFEDLCPLNHSLLLETNVTLELRGRGGFYTASDGGSINKLRTLMP